MNLVFRISFFLFIFSAHCLASDSITINACTNNHYRSWWDVQHYTLKVEILTNKSDIEGKVLLKAKIIDKAIDTLQIDLQQTLKVTKISFQQEKLDYTRIGDHYLVFGNFSPLQKNASFELEISYEGSPHIAKNPPWDGGFVRKQSAQNAPWMSVACQGIGASVWWPCKDIPNDEPDYGVDLYYTTLSTLKAIGNGRLYGTEKKKKKTTYHWRVENPINLYDITFYIGNYTHFSDTLQGLKGTLSLDYYVLEENLEKAKKQFKIVKPMLHCFEHWLGAYPFYEDGYKLVEAPYLGMEHQSAIAYGNQYKMGYNGIDRSKTGIGMLFDFIIVHESAHEWFGNSVSASDVAYSWIHEGFTTYCETLLAEYLFGQDSAYRYQRGQWKIIRNKKPVEGKPNLCDGGSADQYEKASALVHMIRQIVGNKRFRKMLQALNKQFYHKTVDAKNVIKAMNNSTFYVFNKMAEQYLHSTKIPILVCKYQGKKLSFRWRNAVDGFDMPVLVYIKGKPHWLKAKNTWQTIQTNTTITQQSDIKVDPNFLIGFAVMQ